MANRLLWQFSFPSCFLAPHAPSDTSCTPPFSCLRTFASAVHKEIITVPVLPGTIFSAFVRVWTCFYPFPYFFSTRSESILLEGENPYSMYVLPVSQFSSDLDPKNSSSLLDVSVPSFDDRIQL
jgi:hypothetical protein